MVEVRYLLTAGASLAAAASFFFVAHGLSRRAYPSHYRSVGLAFSAWWALFALEALTDGLRVLLAVGGDPNEALYFTLARVKILASAAALIALGIYVLYLWTGRAIGRIPLIAFALAHGGLFLYLFELREPVGVALGTWAPRLILGEPTAFEGALQGLSIVFYFLPPILLTLGFALLAFRVESRSRKTRVVSVAGVLLIWHITQLWLANPKTSGDSPIFIPLALANVVAALWAYATYFPPAWLKSRLDLHSLTDERDRAQEALGRQAH